ncbi:MAG: MarR family winged helix-turn-helix transcriptional regulator [Chthonomonadales bacterium]
MKGSVPFGLKITQLNTLVAIAKMREVKLTLLSEILHMDVSTLSRNVDRMRQRGWITANSGEDGRIILLSLTEPGQELLQSATAAWQSAQEQVTLLLGLDGVAMLHQLTRSLGQNERK